VKPPLAKRGSVLISSKGWDIASGGGVEGPLADHAGHDRPRVNAQFNSAELCVLSGIGRTAMSQIKNASDTPFSLGKCTLQRLDKWLAEHPGQKQE
jgi:hypothetical protein